MTRLVAVVALGMLVVGCSSVRSTQSFCEHYRSLQALDPFDDLDVARPAEIRDAYLELVDASRSLADVAPSAASRTADEYADTVDTQVALLAGADFDLRALDTLAFRQATDAYYDAAERLDRDAAVVCKSA